MRLASLLWHMQRFAFIHMQPLVSLHMRRLLAVVHVKRADNFLCAQGLVFSERLDKSFGINRAHIFLVS